MTDWISVKDRLPHDYEYVLVYALITESDWMSSISIARQFKGIWEMLSSEDDASVACGDLTWEMDPEDITHWMPLPKPPKELKCQMSTMN